MVKFVDNAKLKLDKFRASSSRKSHLLLFAFKWFPCVFFLFLPLHFIVNVLICVLWWFFVTIFFDHRQILDFSPVINIWFGVPGSGKTSMAALLTRYSLLHGYKVLSNVQIAGAFKLESNDLGTYDMSFGGAGAHVIYDEGSIDFDNRKFGEFANSNKPKYFALHRHMRNRVDVFSQAFDIDKRIRDRAGSACLFQLQRLPIPGLIMYRRIRKVLMINKEDKQLIDGFSYAGLPRVINVRSVWDSFDTLDLSLCPKAKKHWELW